MLPLQHRNRAGSGAGEGQAEPTAEDIEEARRLLDEKQSTIRTMVRQELENFFFNTQRGAVGKREAAER